MPACISTSPLLSSGGKRGQRKENQRGEGSWGGLHLHQPSPAGDGGGPAQHPAPVRAQRRGYMAASLGGLPAGGHCPAPSPAACRARSRAPGGCAAIPGWLLERGSASFWRSWLLRAGPLGDARSGCGRRRLAPALPVPGTTECGCAAVSAAPVPALTKPRPPFQKAERGLPCPGKEQPETAKEAAGGKPSALWVFCEF